MFNEFILYISNPMSWYIILSIYFGSCFILILHNIKLNTKTVVLRVVKSLLVGFIITTIVYLSIPFLITRQIFNDIVYLIILLVCCGISFALTYTEYFSSDKIQRNRVAKRMLTIAKPMPANKSFNVFLDSVSV